MKAERFWTSVLSDFELRWQDVWQVALNNCLRYPSWSNSILPLHPKKKKNSLRLQKLWTPTVNLMIDDPNTGIKQEYIPWKHRWCERRKKTHKKKWENPIRFLILSLLIITLTNGHSISGNDLSLFYMKSGSKIKYLCLICFINEGYQE